MESKFQTSKQRVPERTTLTVTNIGGIDETEVTFESGVTVLSGRNATNRTSLLQGLMAALGSDRVSLKADADEGSATLTVGDDVYPRALKRRNGTMVTDGDPYLEDPELADLFAFLLENNEARQAVARGNDLRELIMRPVDTEEIQTEIERLEQRKSEIDGQLTNLDELETKLPELEEQRTRVVDEIETVEAKLETERDELENTDIEERRGYRSELEGKLEELRETRSKLERVREQMETERQSIDALESEREEVRMRLESLPTSDDRKIRRLETKIEMLQKEKSELSNELSQLQTTIQFNKQLLADGKATLLEANRDDESITDQLLPGDEAINCWTCGSSVARNQIKTTIDQLQRVRQKRLEQRSEVDNELGKHRETLSDLNEHRTEYRRIRRRFESIEDEIDRRKSRVDDLTSEREEFTDEIDDLEAKIEMLETDDQRNVLDQHEKVNRLEFELERKERERDEIDDEIASIERRLGERSTVKAHREDVTDELIDLRTRIDQIEESAVERFNEHMENLLEILEYDNLDRIWIDRTKKEFREEHHKVNRSSFDLKIVRSTDSGAVYEDTVQNLSESEREVTGLVFALSGYLVHDVHETSPFMLLDSLEAIDSERIATLIEYFNSYVPYLVVALLHEDAQTVDEDAVITDI
ncbi:archaea-specific SMC-related protein [Natrialbaceae archaeon GCM10025810]|uniref:archaea-specific SMC-related protein n=1 Tax=Halovalidus salilacus TaxID=3075124 RepID=UPI00361E78EE